MKSKIQLFVSQKVTEYRTKKGWSFRYLADCINVHHSFIQRCENPNTDKAFNLDHIDALARVFKCQVWDLLPRYSVNDPLSGK